MIIIHKTKKYIQGFQAFWFPYFEINLKIFLSVDSKLCSALDVSSLDINMFLEKKITN